MEPLGVTKGVLEGTFGAQGPQKEALGLTFVLKMVALGATGYPVGTQGGAALQKVRILSSFCHLFESKLSSFW